MNLRKNRQLHRVRLIILHRNDTWHLSIQPSYEGKICQSSSTIHYHSSSFSPNKSWVGVLFKSVLIALPHAHEGANLIPPSFNWNEGVQPAPNIIQAHEGSPHRTCGKAKEYPPAIWRRGADGKLELGDPQEKMSFFQIASGPILSIPFHLKVCQYDPCKVSLKKRPLSYLWTPKVSVFWH